MHLENMTANTTYCYSITYNGNDLVATACSGTFTTDTETTPTTHPTTSNGNSSGILPIAMCKQKYTLFINMQHVVLENWLFDIAS